MQNITGTWPSLEKNFRALTATVENSYDRCEISWSDRRDVHFLFAIRIQVRSERFPMADWKEKTQLAQELTHAKE